MTNKAVVGWESIPELKVYKHGLRTLPIIEELKTERPTSHLSNHMSRQALTGDTVLVRSIESTGRSQTLPWWLGEGGVKTTELAPLLPVFGRLEKKL
jgi:hypothetical protein